MTLPEARFSLWLYDERIGSLCRRGDYSWLELSEEYRSNPERPVLGLIFEENLEARHASALRLPAWFSNLLPEGPLRDWVARDRGVSSDREIELIAQVGHDLPGAVRVLTTDESLSGDWLPPSEDPESRNESPEARRWRFSLAGVALKFSLLARGDRLTIPAAGEQGDWIVKFPDPQFSQVPRNEFWMMTLAGIAGIEVPEVRLVHRDEIVDVPSRVWTGSEEWAYAVRRFDRTEQRGLIHIEDLAQVKNVYPNEKYLGNYETVGSYSYRGHDIEGLRQFALRLAFSILISNGDAHLKNWSLIYRDRRRPSLSPAYDLVATSPYRDDGPEDMGLKFGGSHRFDTVTLRRFERLEQKLHAEGAYLADCVFELIRRVQDAWPRVEAELADYPLLTHEIGSSIKRHSQTIMRQ
ncbi:HipA domain-containing protein [Micromonospora sp. WMMD975]|uniref:type II toxin-antitoxin system HipA family toxin n=1 Tax=Micromonospora sp. WMMD975 TaxID=3016087 RepID=UPI00249A5794|nr:HipA domain-containing protein [Micromonospora sp. WMMD975]WFE32934.1 HipA domain-containing protein [Micromonospora sp. WMMD975]